VRTFSTLDAIATKSSNLRKPIKHADELNVTSREASSSSARSAVDLKKVSGK
jgi:hypothetical protein